MTYHSQSVSHRSRYHFIIFNLMYFRLALMLQSYMYFSDRLVGKPSTRIIDKAPNLGPLCKKYWKKAKLLRQFVTSLQAEVFDHNQAIVNDSDFG